MAAEITGKAGENQKMRVWLVVATIVGNHPIKVPVKYSDS